MRSVFCAKMHCLCTTKERCAGVAQELGRGYKRLRGEHVLCSRENNVLTGDGSSMKIAVMPSCKRCVAASSSYFLLVLKKCFRCHFSITQFC